jgi:hypothetical protein
MSAYYMGKRSMQTYILYCPGLMSTYIFRKKSMHTYMLKEIE